MWQWLIDFLGFNRLLSIESSNGFDIHAFLTLQGIEALISPIFPLLLVIEFGFLTWVYRKSPQEISSHYKIPVMMYVVNAAIAAFIFLHLFEWTFDFFSRLAPFTVEVRFRYFLYAYVVWEFSHYVYHYTCHKVRILWLFHAPHHAPAKMNLSVTYTSFFMQGIYATFIRTAICALFGIPLPLLFLIMVIDACWAALIHVSEEVWAKGTPGGILGKLFLWPSDHRVHHAYNPQYIDMNYCNTLPIWDKTFRTLQREIPGVRPKYGLARENNPNSFADTYFGEVDLLLQDIFNSRSLKYALGYIFMPPGWKPKNDAIQNTTIHTLRGSLAPIIVVIFCIWAYIYLAQRTHHTTINTDGYAATLSDGIQFAAKPGYPAFIKSADGMSSYEKIGRWSDKDKVVFTFQQNLPAKFILALDTAGAFGPNTGKYVQVQVGDWTGKFLSKAEANAVNLEIMNNSPTDKIEFIIPEPKSPKELGLGNDSRTLGIMFKQLSIMETLNKP